MGLGDQLIGTGLARGAHQRGRRVAFGDGKRILWDQHSAQIFRGNPNIAVPGQERAPDIEWVPFYKGHRIYNRHDRFRNRWVWNYKFKPVPGQLFLDAHEKERGCRFGDGFVLIEPHVELWKSVAPNKDWGLDRYQAVADRLARRGLKILQFGYGKNALLRGAEIAQTTSFRDAVAILANAALYIGPEGGLHHAAAAVDRPGVVLFGGFIPPSVTGYDAHTNLTGGAAACGSLSRCEHCIAALDAISVDEVVSAAEKKLRLEA